MFIERGHLSSNSTSEESRSAQPVETEEEEEIVRASVSRTGTIILVAVFSTLGFIVVVCHSAHQSLVISGGLNCLIC